MATMSRSTFNSFVLEWMGVKPAGQSASGEHANFVGTILDSKWDGLQDRGLAPYAKSAIPEWAQMPLAMYVAVFAGPRFGKMYPIEQANAALQEMAVSVFGGPAGKMPTKTKDF